MDNVTMKLFSVIFTLSFLCLPLQGYTADYLELSLPGKQIQLPVQSWSKAKDEVDYAKNYEQKEIGASHKYGRVVTVFLLPMSDDRKVGIQISDNEYLEVLVVHDGLVTTQVKVDKGQYWVMCRETFLPKERLSVDVGNNKAFLSKLSQLSLWMDYQSEVDETRNLLQTLF
jgi:hypothetical protein